MKNKEQLYEKPSYQITMRYTHKFMATRQIFLLIFFHFKEPILLLQVHLIRRTKATVPSRKNASFLSHYRNHETSTYGGFVTLIFRILLHILYFIGLLRRVVNSTVNYMSSCCIGYLGCGKKKLKAPIKGRTHLGNV